jgi:signal transduction histidine kinase
MDSPIYLSPENILHGYAYHHIVLDADNQPCDYIFLDVNTRFEALTGLKRADIIHHRVTEILPGINKGHFDWIQKYGHVALTGEACDFIQYSEILKKWYKVSVYSPCYMDFVTMFDDITELKTREMQLAKTIRVLRATHLSNQALVHMDNEQRLLEKVCQIIIDEMDYDLVWIGYLNENLEIPIKILASRGKEEGFLQRFQETWGDAVAGTSACGKVLQKKEKVLISSIQDEMQGSSWRTVCLSHGFQAVAAIPLIKNENCYGIMAIYSKHLAPFDEMEIQILEEFAMDLAYGIMVHRMKDSLQQHQLELETLVADRTTELQEKNYLLNQELQKNHTLMEENAYIIQELNLEKQIAIAANKAKSDFIANASHDLRTPLNGILGFLELLIDGKVGVPSSEQTELLQLAYENAKFLLLILNDIIDISKIESGQIQYRPQSVDALGLFSRTKLLFLARANEKRIDLQVECNLEEPTFVVDETKFKQILHNLVSNAIKFTPAGGKVGVELKDTPTSHHLRVWDTGRGISPENLGRVFFPFQRFTPTVGKIIPGTGLGLYITKNLVEIHGGTITVKSVENQGTTFDIDLPKFSRPP